MDAVESSKDTESILKSNY